MPDFPKPHLSADDDEPIVIEDDAAATRPPRNADAASSFGEDARAYLSSQGITSAATLAAFRLDTVRAAELEAFGLTGRRAPRGDGVMMPTFDPREPDRILGLVRLTPAQAKHGFATTPAGVAGSTSLRDAARVVLVDHPLLALRLHQGGVADVALVEDPAVLPPLYGWLEGRGLVLAGHREAGLRKMRAALGLAGADAPTVVLSMAPDSYSDAARKLLGLPQVDEEPRPPITPRLLTDLHAFARSRVEAGEARRALASLGLDVADLVNAYQVGYLPADYANALPREAKRALVGRKCGNALFIPAFDAQGVMVDALIARTHTDATPTLSFWSEPRGLLAPEIPRGHGELIVTDTVRSLGALFREGYRNVLLLRGVFDVQANAEALRSSGIERLTIRSCRDGDRLGQALHAIGLSVRTSASTSSNVDGRRAAVAVAVEQERDERNRLSRHDEAAPPASLSTIVHVSTPTPPVDPEAEQIVLVEEDRPNATALFESGPLRYAVELREDGDTRRRVVVKGNGRSSQDRFDLANDVQRQRYSGNAAARLGVDAATIAGHLALLLPAVQKLEDQHEQAPAVAVAAEDRDLGLAMLQAPDLLDRAVADLTSLGWLGEDHAKRLLYLVSISRLLPQPVWACYQAGAGAAPWKALACLAALVPSEAQSVFHRLTDASITHADRSTLRHRLLIVDQAETLRPEAALALRVLHERGGIGWATAGGPSAIGEARGPVAVLAAAAGALDPRCRDAFLTITVDESPAQTAAIQADQRRLLAGGAKPTDPSIVRRHHAAQRLLERLPVRIPFADRIIFPGSRVRHRDEQAWFLGLVAASALLHQRQRSRQDGAVLASEVDFHLVVRCVGDLLGAESGSISAQAHCLLTSLYANRLARFTMADLPSIVGRDWTRYAFRSALQDLMDFGHIESPEGGRGKLRQFRLVIRPGGAATLDSAIRLRPADVQTITGAEAEVGELMADVGERDVANFSRRETGT